MEALTITNFGNSRARGNPNYYFKVPALPWIPLFNVWVNIYLMTALEVSIWIKLAVWLGIGYAIYFFYGIRNSRENVTRVPQDRNDEEEMVLTGDQNF